MPTATAVKIVDASAIAAFLFWEPGHQALQTLFSTDRLVAPALLSFELANVCITKIRREAARRDEYLTRFGMLLDMQIETAEIDHAAVVALAGPLRLPAYDASYLWLAEHLGGTLITLDRRLAEAAAQCGVPTPRIPG